VFLHFKNTSTIHYRKSLYSIVVKQNVQKMSSVHGSSVFTVKMHRHFVFTLSKVVVSFVMFFFSGNLNITESLF